MIVLATALLLAGLPMAPSLRNLEANMMLRNVAVDHDLARVKQRIEKSIHGQTAAGPEVAPSALPHVMR